MRRAIDLTRHALLSLALLVLLFEVANTTQQLSVIFAQAIHVCQDHTLGLVELLWALNLIDVLLQLLGCKVG